jgi:aryl-alcohol dehydrogenase-like predicted oxidoreductase
MGVASINEYYLHQPDENNSLLESLQTLNALVQDGIISSIGMSNYRAAEVQRAFDLCNEYNLVKPSVYQGLYNPLNRCVEEELLPVLRQNGCAFVAYNPLAAGFLTGKHQKDTVVAGRFKDNPNYLPRFY